MDKYKFEQNLRAHLESRSYSQSALARELHVHRTTVSKWLTGQNQISYEDLYKICKALALSEKDAAALFQYAGYEGIERVEAKTIDPNLEMIASPREQKLSYYIYISDTKVQMLYEQLLLKVAPGQAFNRFHALSTVLAELRQQKLVGALDSNKPYVYGECLMHWGAITNSVVFITYETSPKVYMSGSVTHMVSPSVSINTFTEAQELLHVAPSTLYRMLSDIRILSNDKSTTFEENSTLNDDVYWHAYRAGVTLSGAGFVEQRLTFVARVLKRSSRFFDGEHKVIFCSPLYVELTDV